MNSVKTPKGTELPLVSLKGKPYLQVAHRLIWFNEENTNFNINTEFLLVTDEQTIAKATVTLFDKDNKAIKQTQATKRETKKDFSDHTEKAETAAVGRALAMMGYGTQFAIADLDEGDRIVDSPVVDTRKATPTQHSTPVSKPAETPKKSGGFKPPASATPAAPVVAASSDGDGW